MMYRRRDLLRLGALAGTASGLGSRANAQLCEKEIGFGDIPIPISPPTRPFIQSLPIPPILQPTAQLVPPPDPAAHQRYSDFMPKKFYELHAQEFKHSFHPDLPGPSTLWGYNGMCPGPTIVARYEEPILVRIHNDLPANHVGWGIPSISTHLHNMHSPWESDGFPSHFAQPTQFIDHHYVNYPAGGDFREMLGTLWYHDHRQDYTAANVVRGLTAFYLLFNEFDNGTDRAGPKSLGLPAGDYDVSIILHDRSFDAAGEQIFDAFNTDGLLGDRYTLNDIVQPYFVVEPRKYRIRILNGGPSRFYRIALSANQTFTLITSDGNLLPAPLSSTQLP